MGRHERLDDNMGDSSVGSGGFFDYFTPDADLPDTPSPAETSSRNKYLSTEPTRRQKVAGALALICLMPFTAIFGFALFTVATYYVPWGTVLVLILAGAIMILCADLVRRASL